MNKYERQPDYILDLHGYTTSEAKGMLDDILDGGYRHIRVITGKGTLHDGPVMRTFVRNYLRQRDIEFKTSKLSDGGEGALEVFI